MTIPEITDLPPAPSRSQGQADFVTRADAFLAALITMVNEENAFATAANTQAAQVVTNAAAAAASAAAAAGSANYQGLWQGKTGAGTVGQSYGHSGSIWALNVNLANLSTSEPSSGNSDWILLGITRVLADSLYAKLASDNNFTGIQRVRSTGNALSVLGLGNSTNTSLDWFFNPTLNGGQGGANLFLTESGTPRNILQILAGNSGIVDFVVPVRGSQAPNNANDFTNMAWGLKGLRTDNYAKFTDQKTSGTHGGASSAGIQDRTINTVNVNNITGASLSSNNITLPVGTYYIKASAPAYACNGHSIYIYNNTSSSTISSLTGSSEYVASGEGISTRSKIEGLVTLSASSSIKLQHYIETGSATFGLGRRSGSANPEVYSVIEIWKVS